MKSEMALEMNAGQVLLSIENVSKTYFMQNFATIFQLHSIIFVIVFL